MHSMQEGGFSRLLNINGQTYEKITSKVNLTRHQELEGVNWKEGEQQKESQNLSTKQEGEMEKKRKNERERVKNLGHSQSMKPHQGPDKSSAQIEVIMGEDGNGAEIYKVEPKRRKWRAQARISYQRVIKKHEPSAAKKINK